MARLLISNEMRTAWLTGNLSQKQYSFTTNKEIAFCFDNEREALQFEDEEMVREFIADTLTDIVTYENPSKSIYSAR